MKRSEINGLIENAIGFFNSMNFSLPTWGYWSPSDWIKNENDVTEIIENKMGWDLTDFGTGDFENTGLILFTIRNGNIKRDIKAYCEKIMISGEKQVTPRHYHYTKMEDIINRGGGNLVIELYHPEEEEDISKLIRVSIDGVMKEFWHGQAFILRPGESICLPPYLYHRFYGEEGKGKVLVGEVSTVNNDDIDNHFYDKVGRFPEIEEDTDPKYLLVSDYERIS